MRRAFTLIELLVVVSVTGLLMAILLPVTGRARLQAKVLTVNAELRDIGLALEAYSLDHEGTYPPVRVDCMLGGHFYQLPCELVESGYLPAPPQTPSWRPASRTGSTVATPTSTGPSGLSSTTERP